MKMRFSGDLCYNKLVDNLLIYLVSKFHNIWLNSLDAIAVASFSFEVLTLWNFQSRRSGTFLVGPVYVENQPVMSKSKL